MEVRVSILKDSTELEEWYKEINNSFVNLYGRYINEYNQYGIRLEMKPCYFYNGKYHTQKKIADFFMAYRIRLFPSSLSFNQAVSTFCYKEFFSRKLAEIRRISNGYRIKTYSPRDIFLTRFLNKHLKKAEYHFNQNGNSLLSIQESLGDILRSFRHIARYGPEIKRTFRGVSLDWIYLILVIILICLNSYMNIKLLFS